MIAGKSPLFIAVIVGLGFLLLIAFRSLLVPATAAVMNLLAAGAAFGVVIAVFQFGWGSETLRLGHAGPIEAFLPVIMLSILFGLSMDYQVFLVSRMPPGQAPPGQAPRGSTGGNGLSVDLATLERMFEVGLVDGDIEWLPAGADPLPSVVELLDAAPGAVLAAAVEDVDLAGLDDDALVSLARGVERLVAWAQSRQFAAIARLARRPAATAGAAASWSTAWPEEVAASEIGCAIPVSPRDAARRVELAVSLTRDLPATFAALSAGRIDLSRARALYDELAAVNDLDPVTRGRVEAEVLARAGGWTAPRLRAEVRRRVLATGPERARERHERRCRERAVQVFPLPDGMAELSAILPATGAMIARTALDALAAAAGPGDARTMDQRRADALVDVFAAVLDRPDLPRAHGRRPHLEVTLPLSTLLGLDETPAELAGYGPIPSGLARAIAAEAGTVRVLALDDGGRCLHAGAVRSYRPDRQIAETVLARDRTCRFPGCRRPARRCDLDHVRPYPQGQTCPCNLCALCRFHHRLKHRGGWGVRAGGNDGAAGVLTWTSPTRRTYLTAPPALPHGPPAGRRDGPATPTEEKPPF